MLRSRLAALALLVGFANCFAFQSSTALQAQDSRPDSQPNVVVIFADDLGYGDLSCFGQKAWKTPRLDRMAAEGVRLTDFYVSVPYCAPSRAALLTGRYPFRTGVVRNPTPDAGLHSVGLRGDETTIAEALRTRGYATACVGKWHLGHQPQFHPERHGFDEYYGILYSNDMRPVVLVENQTVVEYPVVQSYLTRKYTKRAVDFIERNSDRPFLLYLPHAMPHKPLAASEEYYSPDTPGDLYADTVRELDASVGEILDVLSAKGLDEKTLVVFTSDNGPWYGGSTGGLRGMKGSSWDGGLRVPFIARWPGRLPAGAVRTEPCGTIDLFPTVAKLCGVAASPDENPVDGRDIWSVLADGARLADRALFGFHRHDVHTVRRGEWKYHVKAPRARARWTKSERWVDPRGPDGATIIAPFEQPQPTEYPSPEGGDPGRGGSLFHLATDPGERRDVASEHPEIAKELASIAERLQREIPSLEDARRGVRLRDGPGSVSPADPLPLDAVLRPSELGARPGRLATLYEGLESEALLGAAEVIASVEDAAVFTEGPAVARDGTLFFTNIPVSKILRLDPDTRELSVFRENTNATNGLLFDPNGGLLACEGGAGRVTRIDVATGQARVLASTYRGFPFAAPNDLDRDRHGRIYFSSRPGVKNEAHGNRNAVYRLDPDGTVRQLLAWPRVHMPNGLVLSPDESRLYLIEAHPDAGHHRDIRVFDVDDRGDLSNERVLIDFYPGRSGDGMAIDARGNLYVAAGLHARRGTSETLDTRPGVHVISPEGRLLAFRATPEDTVTNCTFGGDDLQTLYVTAGTKIVAIPTRIPGKASYRPAR